MNKILRISFLSMLALISSMTFAQTTVTFTAGTDNGQNIGNGQPDKVSKQGVTIDCSDAAFAAVNGGNNQGEYRFYKGSTTTISSTAGNITKIEFTCTADNTTKYGPGCFDAIAGYTYKDKVGTWIGKATDVKFTATANQVRALTIVVTIEGGSVTPDPQPAPDVLTAKNIAEFKTLTKRTDATLTLTNAKVLYTWTSTKGNVTAYVRDETGAIVFFNTGLALEANQDLNGTITAQYDEYNSLPEVIASAGKTTAEKLNIAAGDPAVAKVITPSQLSENLSDLVALENAKITKETSGTTTSYYANIGTEKVLLFNGLHITDFDNMDSFVSDATYKVEGIVASFKGVYQIYPSKLTLVTNGIDNVTTQTNSIENANAPLYNLAGQRVNKDYKGVIIQNGKKFINK